MDIIRTNLFKAIDDLMTGKSPIENNEINIDGDIKFYLKKTKYRLEIRSCESTTWLTYVMLPINMKDPSYKENLLRKYIDLIESSDPKNFNFFISNSNEE